MRKVLFLIAVLAGCLFSCNTPQNITYFQDAADYQGAYSQERKMLTLRPEDKINILVHSADPMLASQFTLKASSQSIGTAVVPETVAGSNSGNGQIVAYTVDEQGDIMFPVLGKISVVGKTRTEVSDYIAKRLRDRGLVKDAVVTVEYVNLGVNVLGEVKSPGQIKITKDHFTLLDAIAASGDLTIDGDREHVQVMRTVNGEEYTYNVNLCSKADIMYSPVYYLQQNDVVYVSPNPKRKRESKSAGNVFNTPGFWMSAASFMMTLITFLTK